MNELVEDFFTRNFRDITERENPEWGEVTKTPDGNYSIRYKYLATIWDKDKKPMDQTFTFNAKGEFVSVKDTAAAASSEPSERRANVVIEKLDITPYREAGLFSLMVVLRNRGSVPSPKFDVDYCRGSAGAAKAIVWMAANQAGPIEPGKSQSAASLPFSVKEGLNEFFVEIDPGSEVLVEDASDHRATLRVRVKDGKVLGLSTGTYDAAGSADAGGGGGRALPEPCAQRASSPSGIWSSDWSGSMRTMFPTRATTASRWSCAHRKQLIAAQSKYIVPCLWMVMRST